MENLNKLFGNVLIVRNLEDELVFALAKELRENRVLLVSTASTAKNFDSEEVFEIIVDKTRTGELICCLEGFIEKLNVRILIVPDFDCADSLQRIKYLARRYRLIAFLNVTDDSLNSIKKLSDTELIVEC